MILCTNQLVQTIPKHYLLNMHRVELKLNKHLFFFFQSEYNFLNLLPLIVKFLVAYCSRFITLIFQSPEIVKVGILNVIY